MKSDVVELDSKKLNSIREEIILRETEDLVKEYSDEFDKIEIEEEKNKFKNTNNIKIKAILIGILFVCMCYLVHLMSIL